jgi:hypothetical protein
MGCETSQGIHHIQNTQHSTGTEHNIKHIMTDLHIKKGCNTYKTHLKTKFTKRAITLKNYTYFYYILSFSEMRVVSVNKIIYRKV